MTGSNTVIDNLIFSYNRFKDQLEKDTYEFLDVDKDCKNQDEEDDLQVAIESLPRYIKAQDGYAYNYAIYKIDKERAYLYGMFDEDGERDDVSLDELDDTAFFNIIAYLRN
jgi:hypothetical protein